MPIYGQDNNQLLKTFLDLITGGWSTQPAQPSSPAQTPQIPPELLNVLGLNTDMGMFAQNPQISDAANWETVTGVQGTPPQQPLTLPTPPGLSPMLKNLSLPTTPQPTATKNISPDSATPAPSTPAAGGKGDFWMKLLREMGIPLAATGIGLGVKGALPGATGFSKGYTSEMLRQKEGGGMKDFIVFDPETGETQSIRVPKEATVQQKSQGGTGNFLEGFLSGEQGGLKTPEAKTTKEIKEEVAGKYTKDQEDLIKANMDAYKKSREEVVNALIKKGKL